MSRCFFAILRDARKIGDMLEVDDAESSPLVGYRHHPESSWFLLLTVIFFGDIFAIICILKGRRGNLQRYLGDQVVLLRTK